MTESPAGAARQAFQLSGTMRMARDFMVPAVAFVGAFLVPNAWITIAFVVVGQAHFVMTYLYQYRGKRMNMWYVLTLVVLVGLLGMYLFFMGESLLPIFLVVATLFSIHFALDEVTLHGEMLDARTGTTVVGFVALFIAMMLALAFPVYPYTSLPLVVGVIIVCGAGTRLITRTRVSASEQYLWFVAVLLCVMGLGFGLLQQVLAMVILLHCFNWAFGYGERVKGDSGRVRRYWFETFLTLVASVALYATFVLLHVPFLKYFFLLVYYDAWAIAHIVLSFLARRR